MGAISSLRKSEISLDGLTPKLALDKSVTDRCLRRGNERDYLVNPEARKSKLAADLPGDSMPKAVKLLPRSAELVVRRYCAVLHCRRGIGRSPSFTRTVQRPVEPVSESPVPAKIGEADFRALSNPGV